jgi:hypothetical protein
MNDHLANLSARIADPAASLRPRLPSFFEPIIGSPALFGTAEQQHGASPGDVSGPPLPEAAGSLGASGKARLGHVAASHFAPPPRPRVGIATDSALAHDDSEPAGPAQGMPGSAPEGGRTSASYTEIAREAQLEGGLPTSVRAMDETPAGTDHGVPERLGDAHHAGKPEDRQQRAGPAAEGEATVGKAIHTADDVSVDIAAAASRPLQDGQARPVKAPHSPRGGVPRPKAPHAPHGQAPAAEVPHPPGEVPVAEASRRPQPDGVARPPSAETSYRAPDAKPRVEGSRQLQPDGVGRTGAATHHIGTGSEDDPSGTGAHHRLSDHGVQNPGRERLGKSATTESRKPPAMPSVGRAERRLWPASPPEQPSDPTPVVHVTIGRIEVRAASSRPAAATPARPAAPPVMSLDDYLRDRARERGG